LNLDPLLRYIAEPADSADSVSSEAFQSP